MKKRFLVLTGFILTALLAGFAGYGLRLFIEHADSAPESLHESREAGYAFISPLLECDAPQERFRTADLQRFRNAVATYIAESGDGSSNESLSVYFRELRNGKWFSIGDTDTFSPASLMKVPLMIAYFKWAEREPAILARRLSFNGAVDRNARQSIKPSHSLTPGKSYTVEDLIFRMIVYSDNNAALVLHANINETYLLSVYRTLGIDKPSMQRGPCTLSIKTYSSVFRILFNASYLGHDFSERALRYLLQSDFQGGIVAGVPASVAVAHKFGECRTNDQQLIQFHDCGIVYYPRQPYLLCIMSRGTDITTLDQKITDISRILYAELTQAEESMTAAAN